MKAIYITIGIIAVGAIGYGVYTYMQSKPSVIPPFSGSPGIIPLTTLQKVAAKLAAVNAGPGLTEGNTALHESAQMPH